MSGDKHPPDNNGEKESLPKIGEIYKRKNRAGDGKDFLFIKIVDVFQENGEAFVIREIYSPKERGWKSAEGKLSLDKFTADGEYRYTLAFDSKEEFESSKENPIDLESQSEEPPVESEVPQGEKELAPEQQKSLLEEQLEGARRAFVEDDYQVSTKTNWLAKTLGLKTEIAREPAYKEEYEAALKALHEYELAEIQSQESALSKEDLDKKIESHLLRYGLEEKIALYTLGNEIKFESEQETWHGKAREQVARIANGYRHLSWKKKLVIAGGVLGLTTVAAGSGAAVAGVAGVVWAAKRAVTATAGYMAAEEGINKVVDWKQKRAETKKIEALLKNEDINLDKILEATQQRIDTLDEELQKRKKWGNIAKMGAFISAIGLPAALSHTDWFTFGEGAEKPEVGAASGVPEPSDALEAKSPLDNANPSGNGGMPEGGRIKIPVTGESAGGAATVGEAVAEKTSSGLSTVTVEKGDNVWNLVQKQLPGNITDEAERNRVTASIENLIKNKLAGLSEAQIKEQYGLSSRDINLLQPGEVIKLDALVTKEELDGIIKGGDIVPKGVGDAVGAVAPESTPDASTVEGAANKAMEARTAEVGPIGFQDNTVVTEGRDWDAINANQGNYEDSPRYYDHGSARYREALYDHEGAEPEVQPIAEAEPSTYSYEESRLQSLNKEELKLARENMTVLQADLFDMSDTPDGPQYPLGKLSRETLWGLYENKGMQGLIATDNPRFEGRYDPRDWYAERSARGLHGRYPGGIQLPERFPQPTLSDGPDWRANYEMDKLQQYYRNNLRDMSYAAVEQWGTVALPQGSKETVKEYMSRILALYTRERIKNPEFRLNF